MAYLRYGLNTIFNNYNVVFGHWSLFYEENTALHIWVTLDGDSLSWDCCGQKLLVLLNLGTPWKKKAFVCVVSAVGRDYKGEGINLNGIGGLFFLIYQKKKKKGFKIGQRWLRLKGFLSLVFKFMNKRGGFRSRES